jgi:hypothetical protein
VRGWFTRYGKIAIGGITALIIVIGGGLVLERISVGSDGEAVISAGLNLDEQTTAPSSAFTDELIQLSDGVANAGGGQLKIHTGAGDRSQVAGTADLGIERDGEPEQDPNLRHTAVVKLVTDAVETALTQPIESSGRSFTALLAGIADDKPTAGIPWDVILYSQVLGDTDPESALVLMAGEPDGAAASLPDSAIPDLTGARITVVFASPASGADQPQYSTKTAAWRLAYLEALISRTHGTLVATVEDNVPGAIVPGAPEAGVIPNLPDPTPEQPTDEPEGLTADLDAGALFQPNSPDLISVTDTELALAPFIARWLDGGYGTAVCTGRTADFPSPDNGVSLSELRASRIVAMLLAAGVDARPVGLGANDPLPGYGTQDAHQRSVICVAAPL